VRNDERQHTDRSIDAERQVVASILALGSAIKESALTGCGVYLLACYFHRRRATSVIDLINSDLVG